MQRASGFGRRGRIIGPTRSFQADEVLLRLEDALALGTAPEERDADGCYDGAGKGQPALRLRPEGKEPTHRVALRMTR